MDVTVERPKTALYDELRRKAGLPEEISPATVARVAAMLRKQERV